MTYCYKQYSLPPAIIAVYNFCCDYKHDDVSIHFQILIIRFSGAKALPLSFFLLPADNDHIIKVSKFSGENLKHVVI